MNLILNKQLSITKIVGLLIYHVLLIVSMLMRNIGKLNRLRFVFNDNYPIEAPEVVFVGKTPDHEHVYSNGFICMSVLYDGKLTRLERSYECWIDLSNTNINVSLS